MIIKNLLFVVLLFFLLSSCASTCEYVQVKLDKTTKKPLYQEIVFQSGMSQEEMFLKANLWLARAFIDSKSLISYSDSKSGYIIGKGNVPVYGGTVAMGSISYVIEVAVKDGKARISLDQFNSDLYGIMTGKPDENNTFEECIYGKIDKYSEKIIKDFKENAFRPTSSEF